ncbi:ArfGap-domain-containing protein [Wilcoxina mikolae CBS 423.85]|nr:ArfGap-domain-containing protein [Wilcoxina mikolae CBS 423.85]
MSRRSNPAADKAAANQTIIKSLLKLPGNRVCADCKRNKLPRWASWNLGIFICIRCSGIHRGMGTHISKVKSVDLDSWTDEQLQSVVKWGNSRANKYWEANLAPGHVPSESKIENFIRTKYESKRWVMEGEIPDPSTLDDSDDDNVPLKVVQEKLERKSSAATAAAPPSAPPQQQSNFNLFDDDPLAVKAAAPVQKASSPKPTKPADSASLLGLDFFAAAPTPSPRPSSVNSDPGKMTSSSRPDLNRSILSLYASAQRPQQQPRQQSPITSTFSSPLQTSTQPSAFSTLNDSFSSLSFNAQNTTQAAPPKPSPFANLTAGMKKTSAAPQLSKPASGGFFAPAKPAPASATASSGLGDLFDFGAPPSVPASPPILNAQPAGLNSNNMRSLSFDTDAWVTPAPAASTASNSNNAWATPTIASSNTWGSPVSSPVMSPKPAAQPAYVSNDDDDWGNFSAGKPITPAAATVKVSTGLDDDVFGNVWK